MTRPEIISKLSFYLMDKEPLIYLFIINSDFIQNEELIGKGFAGVNYKNNRVNFYYTQRFLDLPLEELYFVLVHEAQHIFKHHLSLHQNLTDGNLRNIAEDAIINTEIQEMNFLGLTPRMPTEGKGFLIPDEFKNDYSILKKDAYTTPRLYNWYQQNQVNDKKEFLKKNEFCKIIDSGEYAKVSYESKEDILSVVSYPTIEELYANFNRGIGPKGSYSDQPIDNLLPVVMAGGRQSFSTGVKQDWDYELHGYNDPDIMDQNEENNDELIPQRVFTENLVKQATDMIEKNEALKAAQKAAGITKGNSLIAAINNLLKSDVNWKKEFKQGLNIYLSDRGTVKGTKQSYITHLLNPRSRYGMLGKHKLKTFTKQQNYVIVAIDTSGSCFYDDYDKERFFTEIDAIAKEMEFSSTGKVYTLMWDSYVASNDIEEYKVGGWKNYELRGGGGTNPRRIFSWLENRTETKYNSMVMTLNPKEKIYIPDKTKLPYLLVLTDGYFYYKFREEDLKFYKEDKKSVMFLTRDERDIEKGINRILYK